MSESSNTLSLHPDSQNDAAQYIAQGLGLFLFAMSVLGILFAGTFPFDFDIPPSLQTIHRLIHERFVWRWVEYDPGFRDRGANILFFMPFGFSLAAIVLNAITTRSRLAALLAGRVEQRPLPRLASGAAKRLICLLIGFAASLVLTFIIETSQVFISFRDPSLMDIWANTVGGVLGTIVFLCIGEPVLLLAARILIWMRPLAQPQLLAALLLLYAAAQLAAPLVIQNPANLSSWDRNMPLVVGNELTSDRPWRGSVSEILLADRAANDDQTAALFHGQAPSQTFGEALLAHYSIRGPGPYPDLTHHLSALQWFGGVTSNAADGQIPYVDDAHWLKTLLPVTPAIDRIAQTWQFSLALTIATADFDQRGPARIAGISSDTLGRDIQICQEFGDAVIRIRTGSNRMPDLYLRDVFADNNPRHLVVTMKQARISTCLDGQPNGVVELTPESKVIWRLYPRGFRLYIDRYGYQSYAAIYRLLVFIPFSALLGATLMLSRLSRMSKRFIAICAILIMAIALELILGHESPAGFSLKNLAMCLIIGLATIGILAWRRRIQFPNR